MTGPELADALGRFLAERPEISRHKVGLFLRGRSGFLKEIRKAKNPKPETVARIMGLISNPPPEVFLLPPDQRRKPGPREGHGERVRAGIRRSITRKAKALLSGDNSVKTTGGRVNASILAAAINIQVMEAAQARLEDPIEQALLKVRKRRVIYRASVHGGPHNRFYIGGKGRETISERELLELAKRMAA